MFQIEKFCIAGSKSISYFSPTDGTWPRVMRVHPVLDWSYAQVLLHNYIILYIIYYIIYHIIYYIYAKVWQFIRGLSLPYPSLYDAGYTSLGNPDNTKPNPALKYETESGEERFKPAYELQDQSLERQGRC